MSRDANNVATADLGKLPQLPVGWVWCPASDVCETIASGSTPKADLMYRGEGDVPFIKVYNLTHDGTLDFSVKPTFIDQSTHEGLLKRSRGIPGDVLINIVGPPLGKVSIVPGDYPEWNMNQAVVLFRPVTELSNRYLAYALLTESVMRRVTKLAKATAGQFNIGVNMCRHLLSLPIAPETEQDRIVAKIEELFSDLDAGVAALERAKANLKRYRAAVLKAAVEGKLTEQWRKENPPKEPASKLLERILAERRQKWEEEQLAKYAEKGKEPPKGWRAKYKEPAAPDVTDVSETPDGWTVASMDQLTSVITSGSRDWSQYYGAGSGTFLMAQNIRPGKLDLSFRQSVNPPENNRDRVRSQVDPNDLLVTIVGANTGDVCRVPSELPEHYVCQSVALMRPVLERIAHYLEAYFVSEHGGQRQFERYIYGQGRPHLGFDELRTTPVLLPPLQEQVVAIQELESRLPLLDHATAAVDLQFNRATRLRQSILKRAFEGKLVPQDPNDEPAEKLLERIKAERKPVGAAKPPKKGRKHTTKQPQRGRK